MEKDILNFIEEVKNQTRKLNLEPEEVFLNGNCGNLYHMLAREFSRTHTVVPVLIVCREEPMHMVTEIDGKLYDITGETSLPKYIEFLTNHTSPFFREKEFSLRRLVDPEEKEYYTTKMIDMYRYNEDYEQSETKEQMQRLVKRMNDYSQER